MASYEVIHLGRERVAEGTVAFRFSRPSDFSFAAGQAIDLALTDAGDSEPYTLKHTFSLAGGPSEPDLMIATRMRDSPFKRALDTLAVGASAKLDGPFGSFRLHKDTNRPAVFIAGGIGITPFRSMLRERESKSEGPEIVLFYSNPRPEDAAFLPELQRLAGSNTRFTLIATMTRMENSSVAWHGETKRITSGLLAKFTKELAAPIYFVVGPPALVGGIRETLESMGIQENEIRSEEFFGY